MDWSSFLAYVFRVKFKKRLHIYAAHHELDFLPLSHGRLVI
jgi:hypothetical protein